MKSLLLTLSLIAMSFLILLGPSSASDDPIQHDACYKEVVPLADWLHNKCRN